MLKRLFAGRLSQKGYWLSLVTVFGLNTATLALTVAIAFAWFSLTPGHDISGGMDIFIFFMLPIAFAIWFVLIGIPFTIISLGVQVRRLHDLNHTGWIVIGVLAVTVLLGFIFSKSEIAGAIKLFDFIFLLVLGINDGKAETNRFGEHMPYTSLHESLFGKK